ncbi:MAG: hypothetical protein A3J75_01500 [Acidobacteria bacterium RBG_16_68_9]|nr:MAG: hypothetical protein A3J75_01500 [Acidobacteria bacterium RBG_16_68_9]
MTERDRAEQRARQHQEQLAHVLRVSTMGEMTALLAHELNQPLGAIVNYANGVRARLWTQRFDADEIAGAVSRIADEGLRAGEIIRRIRDFLRKGATKREPCDLNHLVREAASLVGPDARQHGVDVEFALADALPLLEVDRVQLEQVILNLLRNGLDAMGEGEGRHELVVQTTLRPGGSVEVAVRDTGVGLPLTEAERIFAPFFTTKADGLGMGLSISRSIIEAHGGRLWAEQNPTGGATFTFTLPAPGDTRIAVTPEST